MAYFVSAASGSLYFCTLTLPFAIVGGKRMNTKIGHTAISRAFKQKLGCGIITVHEFRRFLFAEKMDSHVMLESIEDIEDEMRKRWRSETMILCSYLL